MTTYKKEKATVRITRREERTYSMHGSTKWDDYPYWQTDTTWEVTSEYQDQNKRMIKERKRFWDDTATQKEAEDFALERALEFENKGLEVKLEFHEGERT